ncbi:MAG: YncE family protein [Terracidiphilus sp.]
MHKLQSALLFAAALLMAGSLPGHAQAKWAVTNTLHIGGEGGWDYALVDARNNRLFVTRSTHTQVIDTKSGKVIADIPGQVRSHGTAIVPAVNRGFITDGGGEGAIDIFDLTTYKLLGKIHTMPDSDGILYDRFANLVLAVSGDEGKLMTFSPDIDIASGKFATIDLGGKPEFLAVDRDGKAYVNIPDKSLVDVVDLKTNKVIARWPVAPGGENVGMAIDARDHLLFLGCRNPQKLVVMSTENGKVIADLPIGTGNDAVQFANGEAFASCGNGELVVASQQGGQWQVEQVVKTAMGARTMGLDRRTHTIYLPTAEMEPPAPGQRRPRMKPGTFMIVEVGKQ